MRYDLRMGQRVTDLIEQGIARGLHRGAQVVAMIDGEPALDLALGEASAGVPMTREHLSLWMSSGKPVTALLVAQLFEEGRLRLDDPVAQVIPEFSAQGKEAVTFRHLLTHTAGLRPMLFRYPDEGWDGILDAICRMPIEKDWPLGEKAGYHTQTTWFVLAEAVARLRGKRFGEAAREHLFEPIGMEDSWLGMPEDVAQRYLDEARFSVMHESPKAGAPLEQSVKSTKDWLLLPRPGGNAHGPAHELARLYACLLDQPGVPGGEAGRWRGAAILEPETVALFTRPHRVDMMDQTFRFTMDWGLGFMRNNNRHAPHDPARVPYGFGPYASGDAFGHSGHQSSTAFADPAHGLAVAVLFNGMPGEKPHSARMFAVLEALYDGLGLV